MSVQCHITGEHPVATDSDTCNQTSAITATTIDFDDADNIGLFSRSMTYAGHGAGR